METVKQALIDLILSGKEELIKAARTPFIKKANRRALSSARDSASIQQAEFESQLQSIYEDVTNFPKNIERALELKAQIHAAQEARKDIEALHLEYFGKPMKEEEE